MIDSSQGVLKDHWVVLLFDNILYYFVILLLFAIDKKQKIKYEKFIKQEYQKLWYCSSG